MNRRTTRSSVLSCSRQASFKEQIWISGRLLDHFLGNSAQWHFDSAFPCAIQLSRKFANVDVDESSRGWSLRHRAEKVRQAVVTTVLHRHAAIEAEVFP